MIRERHDGGDEEPDNERSAVDSNKRLEDGSDGLARTPSSAAPPPQTQPAPLTSAVPAKREGGREGGREGEGERGVYSNGNRGARTGTGYRQVVFF